MLLFAVGLYLFFIYLLFEIYSILKNRFYFSFFAQAPRERPPVPLPDDPPGPARVGAATDIQGEEGGAGKGNGIHGGHSGLSGKKDQKWHQKKL